MVAVSTGTTPKNSRWLNTQLETGQFKLDQLNVEKYSAVPINGSSALKLGASGPTISSEKPRISIQRAGVIQVIEACHRHHATTLEPLPLFVGMSG